MSKSATFKLDQTGYDLILRANNEGIWDWNLTDNTVFYSDRFFEQVGYQPGELPYHLDTFVALAHPDDQERTFEAVRRHCEEHTPYNLELRLKHKEGHYITVVTRGQAMWDDTGKAVRMIGTHFDISENKRLIEAVSAKEQYLRDCFRIANIGAWEYFLDEPGPRWSDEVCSIHEVPAGHVPSIEEAIGYYSVEARPTLIAAMERAKAENGIWDIELPLTTALGRNLWVRAVGRPIQINGTIIGFRGVFQDITQRKEFENQLLIARQQAEEANLSKSQFLATMSHELRTPMNAILGMSKLALETELSDDQRDLISTVENAADSLLSLLNSILDFSRIEVHKLELENFSFDLRSCLQRVVKLLTIKANEKSVSIVTNIDSDIPPLIVGDSFRLSQILINLISNAIKFSASDEQVTIAVTQVSSDTSSHDIQFVVTDKGVGIPEDVQGIIFEEFKQAEQSTARRYGGSGLGLTIAKKLTELMGGNLTFESREGAGSVFTATIRFSRDHAMVESESMRTERCLETPSAAPQSLRILVAEDNLVNCQLVRRILEKRGHTVLHAINGREVMSTLESKDAPDISVILMDYQMPEVDGYEATEMIRHSGKTYSQIPIIALTANAFPSDRDKCLKTGMNAYVSKPFDKTELLIAIETHGALTKE